LMAIAFAVLGIGGSATDIGIVFAAYSLPNVVFLLAGGVWGDRLPRNLVVLSSDALRAVVQTALAVLLFTLGRGPRGGRGGPPQATLIGHTARR